MAEFKSVALATLMSLHFVGAFSHAQREPHEGLRMHAGFTEADLKAMERGEVVTKILETNNKNEVAVVGVVWIEAPMEDFIERQKDIESFESGDAVLAIHKISRPPRLADFQGLTFPEDDLDDLAECRVGKCPVKVDEPDLERIHREVDWGAPDAHEQANRVIRKMAVEGMKRYLAGGDRALGAYRDKERPLYIEQEFHGLLENSPYVLEYDPALHRYLDEFPQAELPGAEEFLYWSKVQFGLKPVVRFSHVVIYPVEQSVPGTEYVIAPKMLYASHYFHTGLELKYLSRDTAKPDAKGFYLISVNRSRSDGLTGLFGGLVRSRVQSGARDGLAGALHNARKLLESSQPSASPH